MVFKHVLPRFLIVLLLGGAIGAIIGVTAG
jgi:hypothetical protein